ncbi:hypothetical protein C7E17_25700, partial [Stenotrophomonas maltophilia]
WLQANEAQLAVASRRLAELTPARGPSITCRMAKKSPETPPPLTQFEQSLVAGQRGTARGGVPAAG